MIWLRIFWRRRGRGWRSDGVRGVRKLGEMEWTGVGVGWVEVSIQDIGG
jgi:hypothetical protein